MLSYVFIMIGYVLLYLYMYIFLWYVHMYDDMYEYIEFATEYVINNG